MPGAFRQYAAADEAKAKKDAAHDQAHATRDTTLYRDLTTNRWRLLLW
jgi:hypothetical protein